MIITDKFVHIANPRCGSTFSRKAIRNGYELGLKNSVPNVSFKELLLPVVRGNLYQNNDHHGTVQQIPRSASLLPILTSIRHPVALAQSTFALGLWWERMLDETRKGLIAPLHNTSFSPETFVQYLEDMMKRRWGICFDEHRIGYFTAHFITMFSRNPQNVFRKAREGSVTVECLDKSLANIHFHKVETLKADLIRSLSDWIGYELAERAVDLDPTNVTKDEKLDPIRASQYFSEHITKTEESLFVVLARRGANYMST